MPGDPKECRQHALRCMQLASEAKSEHAKGRFLDLAATWIKLAKDLEDARDLLKGE